MAPAVEKRDKGWIQMEFKSEMRMPEFARSTYMGVLLACISASHACSATDKGQRAGQSLWNWDYRCDLP